MTDYEAYCVAIEECLRDRYREVNHLWDSDNTGPFMDAMAEPVREALDYAIHVGIGDHKSMSISYGDQLGLVAQIFVSTGLQTGYWNYTADFFKMFPELSFDPVESYERAMVIIAPRPENARRRKRHHDDY